jgi:superfamily I DNA/RNA helicase
LWVHNFHSFGYRLLRDHGKDIGLAPNAGILDQVGQRLLLRDLRPLLRDFVYHPVATRPDAVDHFADVISRAKDELVTPAEYRRFAEAKRTAFQFQFGVDAYQESIDDLRRRQVEQTMRGVHEARAEGEKGADRAARRDASGINYAVGWTALDREQMELAKGLKDTFLRDAAAFEVLRLQEEATVYELYQRELEARGLLDFGEQLARTIRLLQERPNILLRYQTQFRHVLVDEFQDANMAQILLLELIGRGPDKPDNVVVVGDDDQSIYRFRGASYAAFERFRERFEQPPAWAPDRPTQRVQSLPLVENRRSSANILSAASRLIGHNEKRLKASTPLDPTKPAGRPVEFVFASDEADEADQIVQRIRDAWTRFPSQSIGRMSPSSIVVTDIASRSSIGCSAPAFRMPSSARPDSSHSRTSATSRRPSESSQTLPTRSASRAS